MTKKDIASVLKAIIKYCNTKDFCSFCEFNPWCFKYPAVSVPQKEMNKMVNKIKEVIEND